MKITTTNLKNSKSQAVVLYVFEDDKEKSEAFKYFDKISGGQLTKQIDEYKVFEPTLNNLFKIALNPNLKLLFVGLGKKDKLTVKQFSCAVAGASRSLKGFKDVKTIGFELFETKQIKKSECASITITASRIGLYTFNKYVSSAKDKISTIEIIESKVTPEIELSSKIGAYTSYAMKFTKDLVNEPAGVATPEYMSLIAKEIAKDSGLEIKVYSKKEIKELGMNAFLAVGQGSVNEPKFVHLTYKPKNPPKRKIALVGKGITFDAGGLDIKPATSMLNMKDDMTGAATVLSVIRAVAELKLDIEVHAISALCENMPSGTSYKQGDVLSAMNGKTIEVDNTDAEGRITLADALSYCDRLNVDEVIDIATLTGAVIVALGTNITGVLGNNQSQIDKFMKIAKQSGENVWQMPILDELSDNLKSDIADFKNTGGRNAGTSTAGWFLSNFTKSKCWLHLDIAGTAYLDKSNRETLSGPTGVMIRSLINYLVSL